MPAQSTLSVGRPPPDQAPLGWLLLIPLGALALLQVLFTWFDVAPILEGALGDTDAYTRLVRVLDLHATGDWFDARLLRVNPPEGHVQHWTRLLDALLLAGAWLLQPFLGFDTGLHVWGVLISPVLLALTIVALDWAIAPILDRDARLLACLALLLQPSIAAYTMVGRPDHHSLLLALFVLQLGLIFRLLLGSDRRPALAAGAVAAIGFWVSPEAVLGIAVSLGVLGFYWLLGDARMSRVNRDLMLATTVVLAALLVLERGPQLLVIENDRLSLLHVALFGAIAGFWVLVVHTERRDAMAGWAERTVRAELSRPQRPFRAPPRPATGRAIGQRVALATFGLAAIAGGMLLLFPTLRDGPLGPVDPLYAHLRLQGIVEYQPLIPMAWLREGRFDDIVHRGLRHFGIALVALPFLIVVLGRRGPGRPAWVAIAFGLAVYLPMALGEVHFATYPQALLVIPYAGAVAWLLGRLDLWLPLRARPILRPLLLVAALVWPFGITDALPHGNATAAGHVCPIERVAPTLNRLAEGAGKTVLTFADYAPALLYATPFRVLSIPNHRYQPGFAATYRVLTALDPEVARAEVARRGIDWILLCPSPAEQRQFAFADRNPQALYRRLVEGAPPTWLHPLPLPPEFADQVSLFAVVAAPASATVAPE